jgi:hypothetical protein
MAISHWSSASRYCPAKCEEDRLVTGALLEHCTLKKRKKERNENKHSVK